jgi:benzoyl-CoA reductase/2-hydroxyglutaryl-CoA dehydratase subunit BcrC/BadD/HgdB
VAAGVGRPAPDPDGDQGSRIPSPGFREMDTMNRKDYLINKKQEGKHLLGVFPAQYPKEILWAMDVVPAEIWDPPIKTTGADSHLQPYICSVVRLGLELILQGKCDFLDGFLFPHTCDSVQNLASVVYDYLKPDKPCYFFYHPKAPYGEATRDYYKAHLKELVRSLEEQFGPLDEESLKFRIQQSGRISGLLSEIYDLRAKGELDASNTEFYRMIRLGEYMVPDDLIEELEAFLAQHRRLETVSKTPVILSGVLPNPPEMLSLLDKLGVRVANDDLLNCSRRLLIPPCDSEDPYDYLTSRYFRMIPCSTRGSSISERMEYLSGLIDTTCAKGVIFNVVKFCEPEWFDVPNLREELKKRGVPALVLDVELNQGLPGQVATRVEAFIEIISSHTSPDHNED